MVKYPLVLVNPRASRVSSDPDLVARVKAAHIDCVVQVVHCRREAGEWRVHARLMTMRLLTRAGAFVSTIA